MFILVLILIALWPKYEQIGEFLLNKLEPPKTKKKAGRSRTKTAKARASV